MKEIEAKILDIDPEAVEKNLRGLGAEKIFDGEVVTVHYDLPGRKLRRQDSFLRLRRAGDEVQLTYKKRLRKGRTKTSREIEVRVDDFETMQRILKAVTFRAAHPITKRRVSYQLGPVRFEIDTYPELTPLLEIEAPTERQVVEAARWLGFSPKALRHATGAEIMAAAKRAREKVRGAAGEVPKDAGGA